MKKQIFGKAFSLAFLLFTLTLFLAAKAELRVSLTNCPGSAQAGQDLKTPFLPLKVVVTNSGDKVAQNFSVDIVLSTTVVVALKPAVYSPNFSDDVLLQGGREFIPSLKPGEHLTVKLNGNLKIPEDTPAGLYYLVAVVDSANKVDEGNENNNVSVCPLKITSGQVAPAGKLPDLGMYGFLKIGKQQREVRWGETIVLTPDDARLISNGKPAFDIFYSYREYEGVKASGFKNRIYFNENLVSTQSNLEVNSKEIKNVFTQAYLGPQNGKLQIKIDADNEVAESREDNNFHFFVNIVFQGFEVQQRGEEKRLPDLIVSDIRLVNGCQIEVTIKNIGATGVLAANYNLPDAVAVQMYKDNQPWGGIILAGFDSAGNLKQPGGSASWIWFPSAENLKLSAGTHNIKVEVDSNKKLAESNENNNVLSRTLRCQQSAGPSDQPRPCGIRLDSLSKSSGYCGDTFKMYGSWGTSQGTKICCINKGSMNKLIVLSWSDSVIEVRIPFGLEPGKYRVGVYCNDPAKETYTSGWMDFQILTKR